MHHDKPAAQAFTVEPAALEAFKAIKMKSTYRYVVFKIEHQTSVDPSNEARRRALR